MLDKKGFDLWAEGYDQSVAISENDKSYPFAAYSRVLNEVYNQLSASSAKNVLDIGFGSGRLTTRLYKQGCRIYGQDFSEEMRKIAQKKMPDARLYCGDFSKGLAEPLRRQSYDAIIAAYSLHHLRDEEKISFINDLLSLLNEGGILCIGDVAFLTREDLEACKAEAEDEWDDEEFYFVFEEIKKHFPDMSFKKASFCSGVLTLKK